jgi:hypothetical protein
MGERIIEGFEPTLIDWPNFHLDGLDEFEPNRVLLWNGHYPHLHAATKFLRTRYTVMTMEQGWIPQKGNSYLLEDLGQSSSCLETALFFSAGLAERYKHELERARESYLISTEAAPELPEKFIFVPLQLEHDTQIVETSKSFKTMNSLLGWVSCVLGKGLPVVFKEHPLHKTEGQRPPGCIPYKGHLRSIDLAVRAEWVVGINSTLLAEAILFQKKVISLGDFVLKDSCANSSYPDLLNIPDYNARDLSFWDERIRERGKFKERCDYSSMVLLLNQFWTSDPPRWVVQRIMSEDCRSCRILRHP